MFRAIRISGLALAAAIGLASCYDDHYDDGCCNDAIETIRFENSTELLVDNFIDREYVGTVPRHGVLEINGNFEGRHVFESTTTGDIQHWGPDEFVIYDGDLFVLELNNQGFKIVSQGKKADSK